MEKTEPSHTIWTWFSHGGWHIGTYSEYTLYLTPETIREAGIVLPSGENQTEQDINEET